MSSQSPAANVRPTKPVPEPSESDQLADKTSFGFWVYLMTDLVVFASLFASFAVLRHNVAGGPELGKLFSLPYALTETVLLLVSSYICGLAILAAKLGNRRWLLAGLFVTFILGASFVGMELHEFGSLVREGHGWQQSAALSSFFTLVATHGLHICIGLLWLAVSVNQVLSGKLDDRMVRRLGLFSVFWHFLDLVWIFIFTFVYLIGAAL